MSATLAAVLIGIVAGGVITWVTLWRTDAAQQTQIDAVAARLAAIELSLRIEAHERDRFDDAARRLDDDARRLEDRKP